MIEEPRVSVPNDAEIGRAITILLERYKESVSHGRHIETQRQLVTASILTIAAASLAALATLKFNHAATVGLGVVLVVFGSIGAQFSLTTYGRWIQIKERLELTQKQLDGLSPLSVQTPESVTVKRNFSQRFWLALNHVPLHWLWTMLMLMVMAVGALLALNPDAFPKWIS